MNIVEHIINKNDYGEAISALQSSHLRTSSLPYTIVSFCVTYTVWDLGCFLKRCSISSVWKNLSHSLSKLGFSLTFSILLFWDSHWTIISSVMGPFLVIPQCDLSSVVSDLQFIRHCISTFNYTSSLAGAFHPHLPSSVYLLFIIVIFSAWNLHQGSMHARQGICYWGWCFHHYFPTR